MTQELETDQRNIFTLIRWRETTEILLTHCDLEPIVCNLIVPFQQWPWEPSSHPSLTSTLLSLLVVLTGFDFLLLLSAHSLCLLVEQTLALCGVMLNILMLRASGQTAAACSKDEAGEILCEDVLKLGVCNVNWNPWRSFCVDTFQLATYLFLLQQLRDLSALKSCQRPKLQPQMFTSQSLNTSFYLKIHLSVSILKDILLQRWTRE